MTCLRAHGWKWTVSLEPHECKPTAHKQMLRWPGGFSGFGDLGGFEESPQLQGTPLAIKRNWKDKQEPTSNSEGCASRREIRIRETRSSHGAS